MRDPVSQARIWGLWGRGANNTVIDVFAEEKATADEGSSGEKSGVGWDTDNDSEKLPSSIVVPSTLRPCSPPQGRSQFRDGGVGAEVGPDYFTLNPIGHCGRLSTRHSYILGLEPTNTGHASVFVSDLVWCVFACLLGRLQ